MSFMASVAFAQSPLQPAKDQRSVKKVPLVFNKKSKFALGNKQGQHTASTDEYWINWGDTRDLIFGSTAVAYGSYLFPDSTVLAEYGSNTWAYVDIHSAMDVLDVKSDDWLAKPGFSWNQFSSYTVDSLALWYVYNRTNPNASVVDTVIVKTYADYAGATASNLYNTWTGQTWTQTYFQTDTLACLIPKYVFSTNSPNPGSVTMVTVKIPLTTQDSSANIADLVIKLPSIYNVGANKILFTSFTYKPGVAYSTGDSIGGKKLNDFRFISLEEQGADTYPYYQKCAPAKKYWCDWNESSIVNNLTRYNVTNNSWNGYYIPLWAFTKPYGLEHHGMWYKVTSTTVGIKENEAGAGLQLGQNLPNPSTGKTQIDYLVPQNTDVVLEINDITGKKIMSINEGHKAAGTHSILLNTRELNRGVYFYTLKAGGASLTRKMLVCE